MFGKRKRTFWVNEILGDEFPGIWGGKKKEEKEKKG